jgi:glutamate racemase
VLRALHARLPSEDMIYLADGANCPYGPRSEDEIRGLSEAIARYLIGEGAKLIVVACNTASAAALAHLRTTFPQVPFVGIVPAVKPAAQLTASGVVGVLATPTTFNGRLYQEVVAQFASGTRVISRICAGLVERIEAGDLDGPDTVNLLNTCIPPLLDAGADVIVLGCTHYPFVIPAIRRITGDSIQIIEPSDAIARQTERVLARGNLLRPASSGGHTVYCTTGDPLHYEAVLRCLLGHSGTVRPLTWTDGALAQQTSGEMPLRLSVPGSLI